MNILELLIALDDEGVHDLVNCAGDIVFVTSEEEKKVPPDLMYQVRLNADDLRPMLRKISREDLERVRKRSRPQPKT